MNNHLALVLMILLLSCYTPGIGGKADTIRRASNYPPIPQGTTTKDIDVLNSKILWKGTKMRGLGSHEGSMRLKKGYLLEKGSELIGGKFTADMQSIDVTDIPRSDPVPYNNLKNHLRSEHFLDAKKYPEGEFVISGIEKTANDDLKIRGRLTLKGITHPVEFTANKKGNVFSTVLLIDRFKWNIAYKGNWADRTLVDKDIQLRIELIIK